MRGAFPLLVLDEGVVVAFPFKTISFSFSFSSTLATLLFHSPHFLMPSLTLSHSMSFCQSPFSLSSCSSSTSPTSYRFPSSGGHLRITIIRRLFLLQRSSYSLLMFSFLVSFLFHHSLVVFFAILLLSVFQGCTLSVLAKKLHPKPNSGEPNRNPAN